VELAWVFRRPIETTRCNIKGRPFILRRVSVQVNFEGNRTDCSARLREAVAKNRSLTAGTRECESSRPVVEVERFSLSRFFKFVADKVHYGGD
jgi:hypothetical protein